MKKIIFAVIFLLCFTFSLTGCSREKNYNIDENSISFNNYSSYSSEKLSVKEPEEELLYTFSTKILDTNSGRQNNIKLTCESLNGTIVKAGDTFSFCDTVGQALPNRGYQKAKIFDKNGNVTYGYGGGNCQVSSTLYNVVLQDVNFEVVERHPHAQKVYYVETR